MAEDELDDDDDAPGNEAEPGAHIVRRLLRHCLINSFFQL